MTYCVAIMPDSGLLFASDSTIRSNISVGLPIEMLWYPRDALRVGMHKRSACGPRRIAVRRSRAIRCGSHPKAIA